MASFYTEGLVEKEARVFYQRHEEEIDFEKANYGYNINFVNLIQSQLNATKYDVIFSEEDYMKNIAKHSKDYERIIATKTASLETIKEISNDISQDLRKRLYNKMRRMLLQDGNGKAVKEKLKSFPFITSDSLSRLDNSDELEL